MEHIMNSVQKFQPGDSNSLEVLNTNELIPARILESQSWNQIIPQP